MIKRISSFSIIIALVLITLSFTSSVAASTPVQSRPHRNGFSPAQVPINGQTAMWFDDTAITGIRVYMSVAVQFDIHNNFAGWITQFLHTMRPPNSACLEGAVEHYRDVANVMHSVLVIVPWCNGNTIETYRADVTDSAWWNKYTTVETWPNWNWSHPVFYSDKTLSLKIEKIAPAASNCWQARLWNYQTQAWETIGSPNVQCGTPNDPIPEDGWTSFEEHYTDATVCGSLGFYHVVQSRNAMIQHGIGAAYQFPSAAVTSFTVQPSTRCSPAPWTAHTQENSGGFNGNGIIMCEAVVPPTNCN